MTAEHVKRKLVAILSADVKGYSRLMGEDDVGTMRTLLSYRNLMGAIIEKHEGRVVNAPGDNLLAEFASVVEALEAAVVIQKQLRVENDRLPEDHRMEFRIGINLGDVIAEGDGIYGDGVNIAARIEALAEAGGICISRSAYDQVKQKLALGYAYLGEYGVKNIAEPVRVYRVLLKPESAGKVTGEPRAKPRRWPRAVYAAAAVFAVGAIAAAIWNFYFRAVPPGIKVSAESPPGISLSERASIAVLPFENLSDDPAQEYFSDGITNDIITDLSKFRELLVIASNTVFTYKGKRVKISDVGRELRVRYVLEGSVRKARDKVRINAQLIDSTTGHHLWAERYDRDLKDLFELQDEIIQTIVITLALKIDEAERTRAMRKDTQSLEAYDYLLRGWQHYHRRSSSENRKARHLFQRAIELDPRYASAYVALAWSHLWDFFYGGTEFPNQVLQKAHDLAKKALSFDASNAGAHFVLGTVHVRRGQYDLATSEFQRAIELNPNDPRAREDIGDVMLYTGRTDNAILSFETALRFNPNLSPGSFMNLGLAYYLKGRYPEAIKMVKKGLTRNPDFTGYHVVLAAAYAMLGRKEAATQSAAAVLKRQPFFETDSYGSIFRNPDDRQKIVEGLLKAGLK